MGCGASSLDKSDPAKRRAYHLRRVEQHLDDFGATTEEADQLFTIFDRADLSKDGSLQADEFEQLLQLPEGSLQSNKRKGQATTTFRARLFCIFDKNGDKEIEFAEMLEGIFTFCMLNRYSLIRLAFRLLDTSRNNSIESEEVAVLMNELAQDSTFDKSLLEGIDLVAINKEKASLRSPLTEFKFTQFALKYPSILYPAAMVADELRHRVHGFQEGVNGQEWWRQTTAVRVGEEAVKDFEAFVDSLKSAAVKEGAFAAAISRIRDGSVSRNDVAPMTAAVAIQKEWKDAFGPGKAKGLSSTIRKVADTARRTSITVARRMSLTMTGEGRRDSPVGRKGSAAVSPEPAAKAAGGDGAAGQGHHGETDPMTGAGHLSSVRSVPVHTDPKVSISPGPSRSDLQVRHFDSREIDPTTPPALHARLLKGGSDGGLVQGPLVINVQAAPTATAQIAV